MTCFAIGGSPSPSVTWWVENELVDDTDEVVSNNKVKNDIILKELNRGHAGLVYTCRGINNDLLPPLTTDVRIDMYRKLFYLLYKNIY